MSTPANAVQAFAEVSPHSIHLAVVSDRRLVALRSFSLDSKAAIQAFVGEYGVSGTVRSSILADKRGIVRAAAGEITSPKNASALLTQSAKLFPSIENPVVVAVDAVHGTQPDPSQNGPLLFCAVSSQDHASIKDNLGEIGLAPADLSLAAPVLVGCVVSILTKDDSALVVLPGDDSSDLLWVNAQGVQQVSTVPLGFLAIYDAIQTGVGLKFKAAASKLFYNENYDFSESATKIGEALAAQLKPALVGNPSAKFLFFAGLTTHQIWLNEALAKALSLDVLSSKPEKVAFGLDYSGVEVNSTAFGVLRLAAFGSNDGPWVQSSLDVIAKRPVEKVAKTSGTIPPGAQKPVSANAGSQAGKPASGSTKPPIRSSAPAKAAVPPVAAPKSDKVKQTIPQEVPDLMAADLMAAPGVDKAPALTKKKNLPLYVAGGVGAIGLVVALGLLLRSPEPVDEASSAPQTKLELKPEEKASSPSAAAPVASKPASPAIAAVPAPAPLAFPAAPSAPAPQAPAVPLSGDARRFSNERYRLEVTEKGFIQALSNARDEVLLESAAGISLQGSYVGTDGRRKWFNVGGVDDAGYQASVSRVTSNGITTFNVKVTHPRFELTQTFECLADSIKVSARFVPINLRDPRGVITAVHSVRIASSALNPAIRMRASVDSFLYSMKTGTLRVGFDNSTWARDGAEGKQTIIAGENSVAFHFTDSADPTSNSLKYEIAVP